MSYLNVWLVCFFSINHMHGYIYKAMVLCIPQKADDEYQYVIGLCDYHKKHHWANKKQLEQLKQMLCAATDKHSVKVLTEDLSSCNIQGRFHCNGFAVNARGGFLAGVTEMCRTVNVQVDNLEYRYARACSLAPLFNKKSNDPSHIPSLVKTSVADVVKEIADECKQVASFDDGALCNRWYQQCVNHIKEQLHQYGLKSSKESMAHYIGYKRNKKEVIEELLTFDCELLDAKIVHEVLNCQDKKCICVIAGGSHIERMSEQLKKVGYIVIESPKVRMCVEQELAVMCGGNQQPISLDWMRCYL